jgi:hypothetical protein
MKKWALNLCDQFLGDKMGQDQFHGYFWWEKQPG